jgi:uncharacterized protein involved in exopolysaccharide biosynthesis
MGSESNGALSPVSVAGRTDEHPFAFEGREAAAPFEKDGGLARQLRPVLDLWGLVLLVLILSVTAAVLMAMNTPTTYTARSSMIISSNNRSPDQDAVLVRGYVDYFNNEAYQSALLDEAGLSGSVTIAAHAAASSPILLIEATTASPDEARLAATAVASEFQEDVNQVREQDRTAEIDGLQERLDQLLATGDAGFDGTATALQERIAEMRGDRVNQLQELQLDGGVATNSPSLKTSILLGGVGGLVLGALAALAYGRVQRGAGRSRGARGTRDA